MKKILMIDDDKVSLSSAKGALGMEHKFIGVLDGVSGLKFLDNNDCDLILLDINMPGMNGFEVLEKIRQNEKHVNTPVIFLTSDNDPNTETKCLEAGAMDFVSKPFVQSVIISRVHRTLELEEYRANLAMRLDQKTKEVDNIKLKSSTDPLTGLWNREYISEKVNGLLDAGASGSLLMIDLDNFKAINDNYGHQEGDYVLNLFADTLREFSGENDILCRIGGDEFVAFLYGNTDRDSLADMAGSIIASLNKKIDARNYNANTSVSIGIAISGIDGITFEKLYNCGDKALYYVKNNGKNSYRFYSDNVHENEIRALTSMDPIKLGELINRSDSGHGAYMLDFDNFQHIYNFVKRILERNHIEVVSVLFTINSADGNTADSAEANTALECLDKAIYSSLRRVDISARYSSTQTIVILMDTTPEKSEPVINRIVKNYNELYSGNITLTHNLAQIKSSQVN